MALRATRAGFRLLGPHAPEVAARWAEHLFLSPRRFERPYWEHELLVLAHPSRVPYGDAWLPTWAWTPPDVDVDADLPTVLLVHGWEGRGSQLGPFVEPLVERGFRVVTFDAPGHGDSPLPLGSIVEHARATEAIARAIGPIHAVVAHSVGGAAALLATRQGFAADRFVLLAPPYSPKQFAAKFARFFGLEDAVRERMIARITKRYRVPWDELDARAVAAGLAQPLLVVHDKSDAIVAADQGRTLAELAPRGRFVETTGLGHGGVLRSPTVVDAVREFVTDGVPPLPSFAATLDGELFLRDRRWTRRLD